MKSQQLEIIFEPNHFRVAPKKDEPYRNGNGELLPWEEPEYIAKYGSVKIPLDNRFIKEYTPII